jgi:hypothetical protein
VDRGKHLKLCKSAEVPPVVEVELQPPSPYVEVANAFQLAIGAFAMASTPATPTWRSRLSSKGTNRGANFAADFRETVARDSTIRDSGQSLA